jgi:hypothetical protein
MLTIVGLIIAIILFVADMYFSLKAIGRTIILKKREEDDYY